MLSILEQARTIREAMNEAGSFLSDKRAYENQMLFPFWEANTLYKVGDRVRLYGILYKAVQEHTSQIGWEPYMTPALWVVINDSHDGSLNDPIPANRGMEYTYGLYYLDPEDGKTYLCKRGEESGTIVLQYLPHELIGQYFELVEGQDG